MENLLGLSPLDLPVASPGAAASESRTDGTFEDHLQQAPRPAAEAPPRPSADDAAAVRKKEPDKAPGKSDPPPPAAGGEQAEPADEETDREPATEAETPPPEQAAPADAGERDSADEAAAQPGDEETVAAESADAVQLDARSTEGLQDEAAVEPDSAEQDEGPHGGRQTAKPSAPQPGNAQAPENVDGATETPLTSAEPEGAAAQVDGTIEGKTPTTGATVQVATTEDPNAADTSSSSTRGQTRKSGAEGEPTTEDASKLGNDDRHQGVTPKANPSEVRLGQENGEQVSQSETAPKGVDRVKKRREPGPGDAPKTSSGGGPRVESPATALAAARATRTQTTDASADATVNAAPQDAPTNTGSAERSIAQPAPAPTSNDGPAASQSHMASQLLARGIERPSAVRITNADQVRLVQRVARAFQAAEGRGGEIRLRLSPPELGSLRLEISVEAGVIRARLEAETPTARNILMDNLPALRDRLAEQNIKIEQFDVDLMDRQGGGLADAHKDRSDMRDRSPQGTSAAQPEVEENTSDGPTQPRSGTDGSLNVVV